MKFEIKIRKLNHSLYIDGIGVILLGLWSVLKVGMNILAGEDIFGFDKYAIADENYQLVVLLTYFFMAISIALILGLHWYVGRRAMDIGKNGSKKRFFLIPTGLVCLINIVFLPLSILALTDEEKSIDTAVVTLCLDILFAFLLLDIIISTISLDLLKKRMIEEGRG